MEPTWPGNYDPLSPLLSDGDCVPWTPHDILADTRPACDTSLTIPFVVQTGPTMFMVEGMDDGWTLAELRFMTEQCVYRESRRATYTWPREAFGAMLSRLAGADLDEAAVTRLTGDFSEWIGSRFARPSCCDRIPC